MGKSQTQLDLGRVSNGSKNLLTFTNLIRHSLGISSALERGLESCRANPQSCASDSERVHDELEVQLQLALPVRPNEL